MVRDEIRTDQILHGVSASPVMTARKDPSTVYGFCCGTALTPASEAEAKGESKGCYAYCPIWQLEKERVWERREVMKEPARRGGSSAAQAMVDDHLSDVDRGDALQEWLEEEPA